MSLPPVEVAAIRTAHLSSPISRSWWHIFAGKISQFSSFFLETSREASSSYQVSEVSLASQLALPSTNPHLFTQKSPQLNFSFFSPSLVLSGIMVLAIPVGVFAWFQPRQPLLSPGQKKLVSSYISEQQPSSLTAMATATPSPQAQAAQTDRTSAQLTQAAAPSPSAATISDPNGDMVAIPAAANTTPPEYSYHLATAQGFLNKAITLSQQTPQSEQTKQTILQALDEAVKAVNLAIPLDSRQGAGFLVRARIYKTASVLKPELSQQAEQDLVIARALGVSAELLTTASNNPVEHLPTQQATNIAGGPVIADPESGKAETVTGQAQGNVQVGQVILPAGQTSIVVVFPGLSSGQALQVSPVNPSENKEHATFRITQRVDGQGFTIVSSSAPTTDLALEWRAISE